MEISFFETNSKAYYPIVVPFKMHSRLHRLANEGRSPFENGSCNTKPKILHWTPSLGTLV